MSLNTLEEIAEFIVSNGKGILAADESNPTCGKRFDSICVESSETNRRDYREMLFRAPGMQDNIGGVILFDETIRQSAEDGTPLVELIKNQGALPGIKVDKGLAPIDSSPEETVTQGLDGLDERCKEYFSLGAKFTKWRAVIKISDSIPSDECIEANMRALAEYAKIVQNNNMVPMVEPEVLMDGTHTIERCFEVTGRSLKSLFECLKDEGVNIAGTILKPNMVTSGSIAESQASVQQAILVYTNLLRPLHQTISLNPLWESEYLKKPKLAQKQAWAISLTLDNAPLSRHQPLMRNFLIDWS